MARPPDNAPRRSSANAPTAAARPCGKTATWISLLCTIYYMYYKETASGRAEPSQSRLTPCRLPQRGSFFAMTEKYRMNDKRLRQCYKLSLRERLRGRKTPTPPPPPLHHLPAAASMRRWGRPGRKRPPAGRARGAAHGTARQARRAADSGR